MIYFDNSATTKPYPEALETYMQVSAKIIGNPSSLHRLGDQSTRILDASRQQIADLIGKNSEEIFFTSGGTEGDNWVIKGVAFEKAQFGKHIIVSDIEHPAVKESALWLKTQGFEVDFAPVDEKGFVDVATLANLLRPDTTLVSVMAVNNEIGSIQPIQAISELLADKPTVSFHVDAVQALAKIPTEKYLTDRVDFATFSSHKFHGVRGVGFVYIKSGKKITPLLTGGGQERDYRSTTENVAGIAATAKALRLAAEDFVHKNSSSNACIETLYMSIHWYSDHLVHLFFDVARDTLPFISDNEGDLSTGVPFMARSSIHISSKGPKAFFF